MLTKIKDKLTHAWLSMCSLFMHNKQPSEESALLGVSASNQTQEILSDEENHLAQHMSYGAITAIPSNMQVNLAHLKSLRSDINWELVYSLLPVGDGKPVVREDGYTQFDINADADTAYIDRYLIDIYSLFTRFNITSDQVDEIIRCSNCLVSLQPLIISPQITPHGYSYNKPIINKAIDEKRQDPLDRSFLCVDQLRSHLIALAISLLVQPADSLAEQITEVPIEAVNGLRPIADSSKLPPQLKELSTAIINILEPRVPDKIRRLRQVRDSKLLRYALRYAAIQLPFIMVDILFFKRAHLHGQAYRQLKGYNLSSNLDCQVDSEIFYEFRCNNLAGMLTFSRHYSFKEGLGVGYQDTDRSADIARSEGRYFYPNDFNLVLFLSNVLGNIVFALLYLVKDGIAQFTKPTTLRSQVNDVLATTILSAIWLPAIHALLNLETASLFSNDFAFVYGFINDMCSAMELNPTNVYSFDVVNSGNNTIRFNIECAVAEKYVISDGFYTFLSSAYGIVLSVGLLLGLEFFPVLIDWYIQRLENALGIVRSSLDLQKSSIEALINRYRPRQQIISQEHLDSSLAQQHESNSEDNSVLFEEESTRLNS